MVYGNSDTEAFLDVDGIHYVFGDGPDDGTPKLLAADDIMARYAFTWDGTAGDYTFALDLNTLWSFAQDTSYIPEALQFSPGPYPPGVPAGSFTVNIPEPATLMLIGLGSAVLLRKRKV